MRYSSQQVEAIGDELRARFLEGQAEGVEIVVALVAMHKADRLSLQDIKNILMKVYMGNVEGVIRTLLNAADLIDEEMIGAIVQEVAP